MRIVKKFSTFNFQLSVKGKRRRVDPFIINHVQLKKLNSNEETFSKNVFRRRLYVDYIFIFFIGNNCITMSRIFRKACLEKCILEIALAAINDMKGDNLLKRNE